MSPWRSCAAYARTQFDPDIVSVLGSLIEPGDLTTLALPGAEDSEA